SADGLRAAIVACADTCALPLSNSPAAFTPALSAPTPLAAIETIAIKARGAGAETARLKEADEFVRVSLPDGKQSAHSDARKIFFAIGAQVFEENVAKGNLANALIVETAQGLPHARFINGIRALRRDAHFVERQADGCGLELEK